MIGTRFENAFISTFNLSSDKKKHFIIDECSMSEKEMTALAKRFCKHNRMDFQSIEQHKPYEVGPWQHEPVYGFTAECRRNCPLFY